MLGKIEGRRGRCQQKMRWLNGITDWMDMSLSKLWETVKDWGAWHTVAHGMARSWTWLSNRATTKWLHVGFGKSNNKVAARRIWKQRHAFFSKELLRFWETFFAFLLSPPNDLPVLRSTPWPFRNGLNCISDKWVLKLHKVVTELPVCLLLLQFWVTTASTNNLGISRGLPCDLFTEWEICEPGLERTLPQSRYSLQDDSNRMTTPFRISLD